jgi:hypothetical protein
MHIERMKTQQFVQYSEDYNRILTTYHYKQFIMAPLVNSGAPGQDVESFINKFYEWSDNPEDNEPWINAFTDDAYVQIGPQKAQGAEGMSRQSMQPQWDMRT